MLIDIAKIKLFLRIFPILFDEAENIFKDVITFKSFKNSSLKTLLNQFSYILSLELHQQIVSMTFVMVYVCLKVRKFDVKYIIIQRLRDGGIFHNFLPRLAHNCRNETVK